MTRIDLLTNPMTAEGDIIIGGAAGVPEALAAGSDGDVLTLASGVPTWDAPTGGGGPGTELDYAQITSPVNVTATSGATANTIVTGNAVAYDGSTVILLECWFPYVEVNSGGQTMFVGMYDGSSEAGLLTLIQAPNATGYSGVFRPGAVYCRRRFTPSNASHTYSIRAHVGSGTQVIGAGAGGSAGAWSPGFIRITKV